MISSVRKHNSDEKQFKYAQDKIEHHLDNLSNEAYLSKLESIEMHHDLTQLVEQSYKPSWLSSQLPKSNSLN